MAWTLLGLFQVPKKGVHRPPLRRLRLEALEDRLNLAVLPVGFTESLVTGGLTNPTAMEFAPDGRLFVAQQSGALRVIQNGSLLPTPFVTLPVNSSGERGLLGVTFDPNFATNQFVYVYYTATAPAVHNRISRFTANGNVALAGSEVVIMDLENLSATNHNGGAIHFGPDGKLYVAVGENAVGSNSQTLANRLGKMLRINADGSIPTDNPYFNQATGLNRSIWSIGLRNPFTFTFQPGTARMFINDVGQNTWEEINDGLPAANYGWPTAEGSSVDPRFTNPLFVYGHGSGPTVGCAITGGAFYNPSIAGFPAEYTGDYFFADFCGGWIRRFDPVTSIASSFATGISAPVDLKVTSDGSLYYLARSSGQVWRVSYTAQVIDNGESGFSTTGAWTPFPGQGHQSDVHYNHFSSGPAGAAWSFNVTPGQYRVWATWSEHSNRATNAPFTIVDDTSPLATVAVNQELSPNDLDEAGTVWEELGVYNVTSNSLLVQLANNANEYVIADAVRILRVGNLPAAPEIQVFLGTTAIADGAGNVDFGTTLPGTPVTRTFTVRNSGTQTLTLSQPISVPAGFTLASTFDSTSLAPGGSTTFAVRLDAAAAGTFSGQISFGNNDADENPFNFSVSGIVSSVPAPMILDNLQAGFSTTAGWAFYPGQGYQNGVHYFSNGGGSDVATWTFSGLNPGQYRVSATWSVHPNRATDAPFSILDGSVPLATVSMNQELVPNDLSENGVAWEDFGVFHIAGNSLVVRLNNFANEYVIADAVRIQRIAGLPGAPEIQVLDGQVTLADSGSVDFGTTRMGTPVVKTFTVRNAGAQTLTLSQPISVPAGFTLASTFGSTSLAQGASTTFAVQLDAAAAGSFSGQISFGNNDADENPFNFSVSGAVNPLDAPIIIDNRQTGFSATSGWLFFPGQGYRDGVDYIGAGGGAEVATWAFSGLNTGQYRVSATWSIHANRATNAPFTVLNGSTPLSTLSINQELAPNDLNANAVMWEDLGVFNITGNSLSVQLSNNANQYVIADAIRIERLGDLPSQPTQVSVGTTAEFRSAVAAATPGTHILLRPGVYSGGNFFTNIQGTAAQPIVIRAADPLNMPIFRGSSEGLHFSDVAYLELRNLIVEGASGNGINIDDAGTYDTPSHHVTLSGLIVRNIGATGNQDGIKLSGVQHFVVEHSTILSWGGGGSGIDMVGCHQGVIQGNVFRHGDTVGHNGVQAKGGTTNIRVLDNRFEQAGMRAIQIGGSTGLEFFRPQPPQGFEAKDVTVEGNVIIGSQAAIAFVNIDGATVRYNTFYRPTRWVMRILQETTSPGFVPSRNGVFTDNIIAFRSDELSTTVNIGPNTAPQTFQFARNWWYCLNDPSRSTPSLPTLETGGVYGIDPRLVNAEAGDLRLQPGSPAANYGAYAPRPT